MYKKLIKPAIDKIFALAFLLVLSPIFLLVYCIVKIDSRGSAFFTQDRLGENFKVFKLYKFRTMTVNPNRVNRQIFDGDPEITRVGAFLRRSKLDEIPQLINILRGDMSFIGPRPSLPNLQERFNEDGRARVLASPGLSSFAAVNGGVFLTWPERWVFDRYYVENQSFILDIEILVKTFIVVLLGEKYFHKNGVNFLEKHSRENSTINN